jgi:TatD DNase family protein
MIDTHAHLDPPEAEAVLERARVAGVGRVVTVATSLAGAAEALELTRRHEGVSAALGIHPHNAADEDAGRLDELRELLRQDGVVAVGETGLDYFRDYAPRDAQRRLFEGQLELAAELGKAVVVHTRAADEDTLAVLSGFNGSVILHCFSSPRLLDTALERGWYVSFAGNVTYPKAPELRAAARLVPADKLLAETDSPYLAPQPVRGRPNEPAYVMHTLATLAAARGEEAPELERRIETNADAAFGLSAAP